jgi:CelD/BcsL family acetyltransferase involved in cellulose biosynthesis
LKGQFEAVGSVTEIDKPHWNALAERQSWPTPMQYPIWTDCFAEVANLEKRVEIVTKGTGDSAAVAPLLSVRGIGRRLEFVNPILEPADFVYGTTAELAGLCSDLLKRRLPMFLSRIPANSAALDALVTAARGRAFVHLTDAGECPFLALDERWVQPEQMVNSGRRSDLRRARRNAEKDGALTFEIIDPAVDMVPQLMDEVIRVEAASWKGRETTAMAVDPTRENFYRRFADVAARQGTLRLCFLRIGDKTAAVKLAVESAGGFWLLKIGYDETFAKGSPSVLLMIETIRYAAQRGLRSYEYLGYNAKWIEPWSSGTHKCVNARIYPYSFRSAAQFMADYSSVIGARLMKKFGIERNSSGFLATGR